MTSPWYRVALAALPFDSATEEDPLAPFTRAREWERALVNLGACLRDAGMLCAAAGGR